VFLFFFFVSFLALLFGFCASTLAPAPAPALSTRYLQRARSSSPSSNPYSAPTHLFRRQISIPFSPAPPSLILACQTACLARTVSSAHLISTTSLIPTPTDLFLAFTCVTVPGLLAQALTCATRHSHEQQHSDGWPSSVSRRPVLILYL